MPPVGEVVEVAEAGAVATAGGATTSGTSTGSATVGAVGSAGSAGRNWGVRQAIPATISGVDLVVSPTYSGGPVQCRLSRGPGVTALQQEGDSDG